MSCSNLIVKHGSKVPGLHFQINEDFSFESLKSSEHVKGSVRIGETPIYQDILVSRGVFIMLAIHLCTRMAYNPKSKDFMAACEWMMDVSITKGSQTLKHFKK